MHIGILIFSEPDQEKSTCVGRLEESARAHGHEVTRLYEPFLCFLQTENGIEITHQGKPLPELDLILCRPNFIEEPSLHIHTTALLRMAGFTLVNGNASIAIAKNKLAQFTAVNNANISMPRTAIIKSKVQARRVAEQIGYPVILKVAFGTHGKGVFYANDAKTLAPIVDYLTIRDQNPILIQKFIAEANGCDLRVFVVDQKIIASMELVAGKDDVRANSAGGTCRIVTLTPEEEKLSLELAQLFHLEICGIDLIRSKDGPLFLEINANPGFETLEKTTGVDVAGAIIDYLETKK